MILKLAQKRHLWQLALLFALVLFAQQQSFAHQISHNSHDSSHQEPKRDNNACSKCLALAHLGDSPPSVQTILDAGSPAMLAGATPCFVVTPRPFTAFRSRAPPIPV